GVFCWIHRVGWLLDLARAIGATHKLRLSALPGVPLLFAGHPDLADDVEHFRGIAQWNAKQGGHTKQRGHAKRWRST
ncbi:MAG: hypothetical protein ACOYOZ_14960, partial [Pirellula sp.]